VPIPAQQLLGKTLEGGWEVLEPATASASATGGWFSHGYIVQSADGERAYLKALDFSRALQSPDPARLLEATTQAFNFERDLCKKCCDRGLSRVVKAIADGKIVVDPGQPASVVQYLIFELADGDIRSQLDSTRGFEHAWALRCIHHVATGLRQLHGTGIAHQDLKPSNVLVFKARGSKVGDLGRAAARGIEAPHDGVPIPGDSAYAPPELLYGYQDPDWNRRRLGCDAYLFGSMIVFVFGLTSMTALLLANIHSDHHWRSWCGDFDEILPYLRDGFGRAVRDFSRSVPNTLSDEIVGAVRELCEPDPRLRGHPSQRRGEGAQYSLERYISQFDRLARKAEHGLL